MEPLIDWVLCPLFGLGPALYGLHHVAMHHPESNGADDINSTLASRRDHPLDFLRYYIRFLSTTPLATARYFLHKRRFRLLRRTLAGTFAYWAIVACALWLNWAGATVVLVDINALKLSERAAESARASLERLAEDKDELMGILTHDLKNLLSGMQMSAERLGESSGSLADPKLRLMVENISHSSSQMLAFVKEFLTNASFGHGLTIKIESISLSEAVARAIGQYREAAQRKELVLQGVLPAENAVVQADSAALGQVLGNLLSNAVKFSPPGKEISIGVRSEESYFECYVQDQGPGFTEEDKTRMFQRYVRLSARPTGGEPSAGLGLSIVKKLVDAMGGALTCESTAGSGARFTVRLPKALQQ